MRSPNPLTTLKPFKIKEATLFSDCNINCVDSSEDIFDYHKDFSDRLFCPARVLDCLSRQYL